MLCVSWEYDRFDVLCWLCAVSMIICFDYKIGSQIRFQHFYGGRERNLSYCLMWNNNWNFLPWNDNYIFIITFKSFFRFTGLVHFLEVLLLAYCTISCSLLKKRSKKKKNDQRLNTVLPEKQQQLWRIPELTKRIKSNKCWELNKVYQTPPFFRDTVKPLIDTWGVY